MQIGFLHGPESEITHQMLTQLRESLLPHEVLSWIDGQSAPSYELVVLLASGEVTKHHMQNQTKLALIQTMSTGYEPSMSIQLLRWAFGFPMRRRT